jgi:hypothetical protein
VLVECKTVYKFMCNFKLVHTPEITHSKIDATSLRNGAAMSGDRSDRIPKVYHVQRRPAIVAPPDVEDEHIPSSLEGPGTVPADKGDGVNDVEVADGGDEGGGDAHQADRKEH